MFHACNVDGLLLLKIHRFFVRISNNDTQRLSKQSNWIELFIYYRLVDYIHANEVNLLRNKLLLKELKTILFNLKNTSILSFSDEMEN